MTLVLTHSEISRLLDRDEIRKAVRYQIKHGAELIKVCCSGGVMSLTGEAGAQHYSDEELRVIVDEAHNIKERSTNTAKAAFELQAKYRWCLSGTPLQNRVGELYSLVRFLGGDPFSYYFCEFRVIGCWSFFLLTVE